MFRWAMLTLFLEHLSLESDVLSLTSVTFVCPWVYTFPCQKCALFVSFFHTSRLTLLKWSPLWRWNSQWVLSIRCQKNLPPFVPTLSSGAIVLPIEKMNEKKSKKNESNEYQKLLEIEKEIVREVALGGYKHHPRKSEIANHKSGRRSFRSPDWFELCDLQIFSGGVYPPSATSRTISFSFSNISNSFCNIAYCLHPGPERSSIRGQWTQYFENTVSILAPKFLVAKNFYH